MRTYQTAKFGKTESRIKDLDIKEKTHRQSVLRSNLLSSDKESKISVLAVIAYALMISCAAERSVQQRISDMDPTYCTLYGRENREPPRHERFGFFTSRLWGDYESNLTAEVERFGVTPGFSLWYMGLDRPFPDHVARINRKHRVKLVISHDIRHGSFDPGRNQDLLSEIVAGKWDLYFRRFARDARKRRQDIYYRFGYEMNGGWFPWGKKPRLFIAAWRHVHQIFRQERADNIKWVFSPNVLWGEHKFDGHIHAYYPGSEYVDIVGLDGYNFGDNFDQWHSWRGFEDLFGASLEGIAQYDKPIWIAEVGCVADQRRPAWVVDMLDWLDKNPCIEAFFWFDENKRGEPDFSLAGDPETLPLIQDWLDSDKPRFPFISSIAAFWEKLSIF